MKYSLLLFSAVLLLFSCKSTQDSSGTETSVSTETQTMRTITGTVTNVQPQKDGYTAKLLTSEKEVYSATISIPNMKDHTQYRKVEVGETISVQGQVWKLGEENQITVRVLK